MDEDKKPSKPSVTERLRDVLEKRLGSDREALARRSAALSETVIAQARVIEALTLEEAETAGYAAELMDLAVKLAEAKDRLAASHSDFAEALAVEQRRTADLQALADGRGEREMTLRALLEKKATRSAFFLRACFALVSEMARVNRASEQELRNVMRACFARAAEGAGDDCGHENFMDEVVAEYPE